MTATPTQHQPEQITWDTTRTLWLREVPVVYGEVASSRPGHAPHRVTARLDGTNVSCSCEGGARCTIERDGWGCVASYWAQAYTGVAPDTLLSADRQYAWDHDHCGVAAWMVLHWGIVGDLICWRGLDHAVSEQTAA